jgi:hypothetical protein
VVRWGENFRLTSANAASAIPSTCLQGQHLHAKALALEGQSNSGWTCSDYADVVRSTIGQCLKQHSHKSAPPNTTSLTVRKPDTLTLAGEIVLETSGVKKRSMEKMPDY